MVERKPPLSFTIVKKKWGLVEVISERTRELEYVDLTGVIVAAKSVKDIIENDPGNTHVGKGGRRGTS